MKTLKWRRFVPVLAVALSCTSARLYYLHNELPRLEGSSTLVLGPGPWPQVPALIANTDNVPDELVLSTLKALMQLPGAADACDAYGQPRADAAEYCVAAYKTPREWRVTWPIRKLVDAQSSCKPPFGGVEDADFGWDLPVFGYAHNHPCGLFASSKDMETFPTVKTREGPWVMVAYATTPAGEPVNDSRGQPIAAWGWLATGHADEPRFYKWNSSGEVFKWNEPHGTWEFQASCKSQPPSIRNRQALPPRCSPELVDWY